MSLYILVNPQSSTVLGNSWRTTAVSEIVAFTFFSEISFSKVLMSLVNLKASFKQSIGCKSKTDSNLNFKIQFFCSLQFFLESSAAYIKGFNSLSIQMYFFSFHRVLMFFNSEKTPSMFSQHQAGLTTLMIGMNLFNSHNLTDSSN